MAKQLLPATWLGLNERLRAADEAACQALLAAELRGQRRCTVLLRIHSRLNRVRAAAERAALRAQARAPR